MLEPADTPIVRRDARLPGLRTLLDEDAFCEAVRRMAPDRDIRSVRSRYVRYKPGTSCLVAFVVEVGGRFVDAYARCHTQDRVIKVSNARQRLEVVGPLGHGLLTDPGAGIAVFVYPNDYEIRSLRKLFEGERTPRRVRRMLPAHPHLQDSIPQALRYKPERRFVCKMEGAGGPPAMLRLYPGSCFTEMRERAWAFKSADGLHLPKLVGDSERYAALAYEWVEGSNPTGEMMRGGGTTCTDVARALLELHRQRPRLGSIVSAYDYCQSADSACEALASLDESCAHRAREQIAAVRGAVLEGPWRPHAVHGDFTIDQVLVSDGRITVLDFDRSGYGEPAVDLGAFAADQISRAIMSDASLEEALATGADLIAAYRLEGGRLDPATVRACTAISLLMMAPEPFRTRMADWPERTVRLLDSIDRVLSEEVIDA